MVVIIEDKKKMEKKIRVGALISGSGTNLQAIMDACENNQIPCQMAFVGSDRIDAKGLQRAQNYNLRTFFVDYAGIIRRYKTQSQKFRLPEDFNLKETLSKQKVFVNDENTEKVKRFIKSRVIAEDMLLREISRFQFDLLVLAGFMRKLTPYFIDRVNTDYEHPKVMNIHPALLPAFPGVDGYGDTFRYGCKVGGCTVHFVNYGEDTGPIIAQKSFQILPHDTLETVKKKGLNLEWQLYPECIRLFAEGRLKVVKKSWITDGQLVSRRIVNILSA